MGRCVHDVIVVGGGPAGAATAALLARAGLDVLLLDRARFPRDKPCGEFLTSETVRLFRRLGVWSSVLSAGAHPICRAVMKSAKSEAVYHGDGVDPVGWSMRRTDLDAILLRHAKESGAEVLEGAAVRSLRFEGRRVTGVWANMPDACEGAAEGAPGPLVEFSSRMVIGADGSHSMVARQLGLVKPIKRLQRIALVSHWSGAGACGIEMRASGRFVCGIGELAGGDANLTLVAPTAEAAKLAGRPEEYLLEMLAERLPDAAARLGNAQLNGPVKTIGCFGHMCRKASAEGALLVGDAATFVDPFTGEGVYLALRGAELAAGVAVDALRADDLTAARLGRYDDLRAELRRRYLLSGIIQAVVRTPALYDLAIRRLANSPATTRRLMETLGDIRPASDALSLSFLHSMMAAN